MFFSGVEFGARMISIDGKQIKLQIWDTVSVSLLYINPVHSFQYDYFNNICEYLIFMQYVGRDDIEVFTKTLELLCFRAANSDIF